MKFEWKKSQTSIIHCEKIEQWLLRKRRKKTVEYLMQLIIN